MEYSAAEWRGILALVSVHIMLCSGLMFIAAWFLFRGLLQRGKALWIGVGVYGLAGILMFVYARDVSYGILRALTCLRGLVWHG